MRGCRPSKLLAGVMLAMLASGCLSSGRDQSSRNGGPSPSFGLNYVPQQSEPPVENVAKGPNSAAPADATADLDAATGAPSGKSGNKLVSWLPGRDKELPERKPLPLSARSAVAADDDQGEP